jgi:uncharacterized protein YndB with AHSA1/START domain
MSALSIEAPSDRQILLRRSFAAPPARVYRAHVDTDVIPLWMTALPGWSMPVAETDPRPGGSFRFAWEDGQGNRFRIEGEYVEVEPGAGSCMSNACSSPTRRRTRGSRPASTSRGTGTALSVLMTLPDAETLRALLQTGMTDGMEKTYDRLEALLAADAAS